MNVQLKRAYEAPARSDGYRVLVDRLWPRGVAKVKAKIAEDPHLSAFAIEVETQRGIVQLSGFVDSSAQRTAAGRIARSVEGVKSVKNSLTVKPRS